MMPVRIFSAFEVCHEGKVLFPIQDAGQSLFAVIASRVSRINRKIELKKRKQIPLSAYFRDDAVTSCGPFMSLLKIRQDKIR